MKIRNLEAGDLEKGLLEVLANLSNVETIPPKEYVQIVHTYNERKGPYRVLVAEQNNRIVGTATLIVARKLLRGGAKAGRISDVATHQNWEGRGVGTQLINHLVAIAREEGCYKITLSCSRENAGWYKRFGFQEHEVAMRLDL